MKHLLLSFLLLGLITSCPLYSIAQSKAKGHAKEKMQEHNENLKKGKHNLDKAHKENLPEKASLPDAAKSVENPSEINRKKQRDHKENHTNEVEETEQNNQPKDKHNKEIHDHQDKAHAHGKNKGDLKGKDFGQERARQAREQRFNKSKELEKEIENGNYKVIEAKNKIEKAKTQLEKDKKDRKISDKEYKEKKEKIEKAESGVRDLEKKLEKGKLMELPNE